MTHGTHTPVPFAYGIFLVFFLVFSVYATPLTQAAGAPSIVSYQGRLTDTGGNALGGTGTTYYFKFSLWDSATVGGGTKVWPTATPGVTTLTVKQGYFNANIGDTTNGYPDTLDYNFNNNTRVYLQIEVSSDNSTYETLSPRSLITSTAFAQVAGQVSGVNQSSFGTTTALANSVLTAQSTSTTATALSLIGYSGQTANIFNIINSAAASLFTVAANGNVGIGTANPSSLLQVGSSIFLNSSGNIQSNNGGLTFVNTGQTYGNTLNTYGDISGGNFAIYSTAPGIGKMLSITNTTGNVGIGTTSPSNKLEVNGSGYFAGNLTATGTLNTTGNIVSSGTVTANIFQLSSGGQFAGGYISIGTGNNSRPRLVANNGSSFSFGGDGSDFSILKFAGHNGTFTPSAAAYPALKRDGAGIQFRLADDSNDATTTMAAITVSSSTLSSSFAGNVGIGSTTPNYLLSLGNNAYIDNSGNISAAGSLTLRSSVGGNFGVSRTGFNGGYSIFTADASNLRFTNLGNTGLYLKDSGTVELANGTVSVAYNGVTSFTNNVGIGTTSPSAKLAITGTAGTGDIFAVASSTNARLLTVTSAGNVGIGLISPTAALEVKSLNSLTGGIVVRNDANPTINYIGLVSSSNYGDVLASQGDSPFVINKAGNTNWGIGFQINGGNKAVIDKNGNLGVGFSNIFNSGITAKLEAQGADSLATSYAFSAHGATGTGLVVTNNNNVGIGTTTPTNPLSVVGTSTLSSVVFNTDNTYDIGSNQANRPRTMYLGTSAVIGSAYPPIYTLEVGGSIRIPQGSKIYLRRDGANNGDGESISSDNTNLTIDSSSAPSSRIYLRTGNVDRWFVDATNAYFGPVADNTYDIGTTSARVRTLSVGGNGYFGGVGIGTTTPTAQLSTTGTVRFSNYGAGTLTTDANGNLSVSSDERLKDIKGYFTTGLDAILSLKPISFNWKPETGLDTVNTYTGFSAQNVQTAIPEAVSVDKHGNLTLQDRPILATLVNAVKELNLKVKDMVSATVAIFSRVETKELCIGTTCVTEDKLKELLLRSNVSAATYVPTVTTPVTVTSTTTTDTVVSTITDTTSTTTIETAATTTPIEVLPVVTPNPESASSTVVTETTPTPVIETTESSTSNMEPQPSPVPEQTIEENI
ncbi:MAG: tail fiber domain-containing protein [Candidatus Pacebacteria bacterium]|nr:tail fiber domain-containing protein [Candidatus Paceibacterota bacterium]